MNKACIENKHVKFGPTKLPLDFSVEHLQADVARFRESDWMPHGNSKIASGVWSVIPLRSISGYPHPDRCVVSNPAEHRWQATPQGLLCPYVRAIVQSLPCSVFGVRFMKLAARSRLRSHVDPHLSFEGGIVRIHVPVNTKDAHFCYEGKRYFLGLGEAWYFDLTRPHFPVNDGDSARIHMTVDCAAEPFWSSLLEGEA